MSNFLLYCELSGHCIHRNNENVAEHYDNVHFYYFEKRTPDIHKNMFSTVLPVTFILMTPV
jgi:hypothetical protein